MWNDHDSPEQCGVGPHHLGPRMGVDGGHVLRLWLCEACKRIRKH